MVDPLAERIRAHQGLPPVRVRGRGGYWMADEHPALVKLIAAWRDAPRHTTAAITAWLEVEEYLRQNLK